MANQFDFSRVQAMAEPEEMTDEQKKFHAEVSGEGESGEDIGSVDSPLFKASPDAALIKDAEDRQAAVGAPDESAADEPEEKEDVLDIIVPRAEPRLWRIGPDEDVAEYLQQPLSFLSKMQWFALVGEVLDKAMGGERPVSVKELLETPERGAAGTFRAEDFRNADSFVRAIGKLVVHAPDFLEKSFCIWLGVPPRDRELVALYMTYPESQGGLSDEEGLQIIETFIDQNYDALADFFGSRIANLQRRVTERNEARALKRR